MHASEAGASEFFEDDTEDFGLNATRMHASRP